MTDPASAEDMPALVDTLSAAQIIFGDSRRKNLHRLYMMIRRDEISARRIGGRWFIPRAAMLELLADTS